MSQMQLFIWDSTNKVWVPLAVTIEGYLKVKSG